MRERFVKYQPPASSDLYKILQKEVQAHLNGKANSGFANTAMLLKIMVCLALFIFCYTRYISAEQSYTAWLAWCLALGFASFLTGVNIGHDAVHHALFKHTWANKVAGLAFDLTGISSYIWRLKHNLVHHRFPNVTEVDFDIEAGPILRLSPAEKRRWFHAYQHWYAPMVYIFLSLQLILVSDIRLLLESRKKIDGRPHPGWVFLVLPLLKLLYAFYMIALPMMLLPFSWWKILAGFALMHMLLSLIMALVLLPSHLFENTRYARPAGDNTINEDWVLYQLSATLDFAPRSHIANFLFGGFNTNVIHHLFPRICHIHYTSLIPILEARTAEFNVPYNNTSFINAVRSHFRALKKLGRKD